MKVLKREIVNINVIIPKHKSAKFLIRIFVTFLLLTDPASRKPNPACKIDYEIYSNSVNTFLHKDDQGSIDD